MLYRQSRQDSSVQLFRREFKKLHIRNCLFYYGTMIGYFLVTVQLLGIRLTSTGDVDRTRPIAIRKRIFGGWEAAGGAWPWLVAIRRNDELCGGALIRPDLVVTAGHCVKSQLDAIFLTVYAGIKRLTIFSTRSLETMQVLQVKAGLRHENYDARTGDNDIGILKLLTPVKLSSSNVGVIALPIPDKPVRAGNLCWIAGWGARRSGSFVIQTRLLQTVVPIISMELCNDFWHYNGTLTPNMFCAGAGMNDACQGDSGGPLVCDSNGIWQLIGIINFGKGCGVARYPGVYVSVSKYVDWINFHAQRL